MKATIIKETVNAERRKEIYELGKTQKFDSPSIFILKPTSDTLSIHGKDDLSMYINVDKIPSDCEILRVDSRINSGVVFTDKNNILVRIFGSPMDVVGTKQNIESVMIETFKSEGVDVKLSTHRPNSNDFVFTIDSKEKKFCGCVMDIQQMYFSFFITLSFDAPKIDGLYKLDTDKFQDRGNVSDITDVVGGINEVNPKIDDTIVDKIVVNLAKKLNWEF